MQYTNTEWTIGELIESIRKDRIDLNPEYQRNPVWRSSAQTRLIESILNGRPLPNFFIRKLPNGHFEMVDGQQRARTIFGYFENSIPDHTKTYFEDRLKSEADAETFRKKFFDFRLSITIISQLGPEEKIEYYYALLNMSGLRLNRPELKKAEYYSTRFLRLTQSAIEYPSFKDLDLFDRYSLARMSDFEAASEIIAQIRFGPFDKKDKIDQLFEDDITEQEEAGLMEAFCVIFDIYAKLDQHIRIKRTRLKQKADFYTYSYLIHTLSRVTEGTHLHFYKVFLKLAPHIRPSNSDCEPLREYAYNCVTQSNSKRARNTRLEILNELIANPNAKPTKRQLQVLDYFDVSQGTMLAVDGFLTFNPSHLTDPLQTEMAFDEFVDDAL